MSARMQSLATVLTCLSLTLGAGCVADDTEEETVHGEDTLRDGVSEPNGPAGIVAIDPVHLLHGERRTFPCTGVVVAPDAILTTGNCAYFASQRAEEVTVHNRSRTLSTFVERAVELNADASIEDGRDVLVLALVRDRLPFPSLPLASEQPGWLESVKIYGFGPEPRQQLQSVTFRWGGGTSAAEYWEEIASPVLRDDEVVGIYTRDRGGLGEILFGKNVIVPLGSRGMNMKEKIEQILAERR
jgi:hypothetical protein